MIILYYNIQTIQSPLHESAVPARPAAKYP